MKYTFKTNINCGGCIAKVSPFIEEVTAITHWEVDTKNPKKILTVESESLSEADIIALIERAGFEAQPIKRGLFKRLF